MASADGAANGTDSGADPQFRIWDELAKGKHEVLDLPLCKVLLMDDANYPCWLVLVPRRNHLREVFDLPAHDQAVMWQEVTAAARVVQDLFKPFKINIAAIGNVVSQLHIHVTARNPTDPSWPGPCYGAVPAVPLTDSQVRRLLTELQAAFT